MGSGSQKSFLKRRGDVHLDKIDGRLGEVGGMKKPNSVLEVLGVHRCILDMKMHLGSFVRD